jgi:hypothetical protein
LDRFRTTKSSHIGVVNEEYAVSADGMKIFGVLDLESQMGRAALQSAFGTHMTTEYGFEARLALGKNDNDSAFVACPSAFGNSGLTKDSK